MNSFRLLLLSTVLAAGSLFGQAAAPSKAPANVAAASAALVDINGATAAQLKSVPGIGDAYAARIIGGRPYANITQLKSKGILPAAVYAKTKGSLIARQK